MYGLTGAALDWMTSYLYSRLSYVRWKDYTSEHTTIDAGVPQGSSLGPQLFSMYVAPLAGLIRSFGVRYHQYADDTQLYIAISNTNIDVQLETLEQCINSVNKWLLHNGLSLNPTKSDAIQFSTGRKRNAVDVPAVSVSGVAIQPSATINSLGVVLDRHLSFDQQVDSVCKACYFHIRALRHVRESLPDDVAKTVACSIVSSRLDYCNALYAGMSAANITKLQRVQNTLARTILRLRKFEHITPALIDLHWLPIRQRITFKLASVTFKLRLTHQPSYLYDLINNYEPPRLLRSSNKGLLQVSRTNTVVASRAFTHSAVAVWNSLPADIRNCLTVVTFRRHLKTFLFCTAFAT